MPFIRLDEREQREIFPGAKAYLVHSENMSFAHWTFEEGSSFPDHSHPHEQVANIIEGEFDLAIEGETQRVSAGSVAIIPPNASHSGKAITRCHIIDAFYPVREDYR